MASSLRIHDHCKIAPPSATATHLSLPLTFFDLIWLKFHPVERIFFYSLPPSHSDPSFFFNKVSPKLKTSLSLTLQHFLPLAGNIVWPSDSPKPIIQFNPNNNDGVSFVLAQCENNVNFNQILEHNSPIEAIQSRTLIPRLESNDSFASVISIQITLFTNTGFSIGISTHHAVLDGKSSTMFIKAWASICKSSESLLPPSLTPNFFDRNEVIKDIPKGLENLFINNWKFSPHFDKSNERSMKIMLDAFQPHVKDPVRATFELTRGDLDNINKRVLSKWNAEPIMEFPRPKALSTFVLTCAYVSVCIAKAIQEAESNDEKLKFAFGFPVDCRARLESPIPDNYFGNCVSNHIVDTNHDDFTKEDGVVIIAKKIYSTIKKMDKEVLDALMFRMMDMVNGGVKAMGVAGSTKFGVYESDFGWGRPAKVEITSVDRGLTIGMTESKDGKGGVEVGLVLNKNDMTLFHTFFNEGLSSH